MSTIDELMNFPIDPRTNQFLHHIDEGWPSMVTIHSQMNVIGYMFSDVEKIFDYLAKKNQRLKDLGMYKTYQFESNVRLYEKRSFFLLCCETLLRYPNNREGQFYHLQSWMCVLGSGIRAPQRYLSNFIEKTKYV